ncbi:asparaginase [bacterium]|nr:MAG: asparaginase [bacterium]
MICPVPMVRAMRGGLVESLHRGHLAVARPDGALLDALGDPDFPTFLRSAAKPFQAIPVVEDGALTRFSLTSGELAVMCGSHSGQSFHVEAVLSILSKIGVEEAALLCGVHPPSHKLTAKRLQESGEKPRPIHNNCSGKHAAMLALCVFHGWDTEDYVNPGHPVQIHIKKVVAECLGLSLEELGEGTDGCGVPVFRAPLRAVARGYARLAWPKGDDTLPEKRVKAMHHLVKACVENPEMVAGDERICTDAMRAAPGRVLAKTGAESSYGLSILEAGVGIAFKIEDGSMRALPPAVVEILIRSGTLRSTEVATLSAYHRQIIKNHRKETVGVIEPCLKWHGLDRPDLRK